MSYKDKLIGKPKSNREFNFKILVFPNITYSKDIRKDSYIVVLDNVIRQLNEIRPDIFWTILTPQWLYEFDHDNVEQIEITIPTYPNRMRTYFNSEQLLKLIKPSENDYDVVYSHLPEQTLAIKNLFDNSTNIRPKIIGYSHWFETQENSAYDPTMFKQNIMGILEMDECGVNSKWLKDFVSNKSSKFLNDESIKKLNKIVQPHYLGVDEISIKKDFFPKTILFNHRADMYTGFDWFIEQMDLLWEKRKDFEVYTTLAKVKRPYTKKIELAGRRDYYDFISQMHMGVATFKKYSAWSISTTDGLSHGVPYVVPNKFCYPEMVGDKYPLLYDGKDFLDKVELMLDNPEMRAEINNYLKPKLKKMTWNKTVPLWNKKWDLVSKSSNDTEAYQRIVKFIRTKGTMGISVTKGQIIKHLGWGKRIAFTPYRNRLRKEKDIKLTRIGYEVIK